MTAEASTALAWNDFYKKGGEGKGVRILEVEDEDFFSHLQDTQEEMRKIFMQIVAECCLIVRIPMLSFRVASKSISRICIGYGSLKVIPIFGFGGIGILTPKKTPNDSLVFITSFQMPTRIFCAFQPYAALIRCNLFSFRLRTPDRLGKYSISRVLLISALT